MKDTVSFTVKVKGETSEREFDGVFQAKTKLSFREVLRQDEVRRGLLGTNPTEAGVYASSIASILAYLAVRVTKAPSWWSDSGNGVELEDENLVVAVNDACVAALKAERDLVTKAATEAQAELKKAVEEKTQGG